MFAGSRLLITGGTSTFGNAVLRRFLHADIARNRSMFRTALANQV
jgi:UDP-N-acetylglucosamine 4,6-dehydratase